MGDREHSTTRGERADHRAPGAGGEQGNTERTEKLEGDGEAEPDAVNGGIQGEIHGAEDHGEQKHRPPLRPPVLPHARTRQRHQNRRRHKLTNHHHPHRPDGVER